MSLRYVAVACHLVIVVTLAVTALSPPTAPRLAIALLLVLPLLSTLPGLVHGRRSPLQRLAVLLVVYVGGATVEVVARAGSAPLLSAALLAAVLELGLVLTVIRRSARISQSGRG